MAADVPDPHAVERIWQQRYRDPSGFRESVAALPAHPVRTFLQSRVALADGDLGRCLQLCAEAEDGLREDDVWRARLLETRGNVLLPLGLLDEAQGSLAAASELYHRLQDPVGVASSLQNIATLRFQADETALELYLEALALAEQAADPALVGVIRLNLAHVGADTGMPWEEREALARSAEAILAVEAPDLAVSARCVLVDLALLRDDLVGARREADLLPDPLTTPDPKLRAAVARAIGAVALAQGRAESVIPVVETVLEAGGDRTAEPLLLQLLSDLQAQAGRPEQALETARRAFEELRVVGAEDRTTAARALDVWHRSSLLRQEREAARERAASLEDALAELSRATAQIRELSVRDPLTGLHNRQHLMDAGVRLVASARPGRPAQVALVDLDEFKRINDTLGHAAGDAVLQAFARVLVEHLPPSDLVARYGGEEFVVVRPPAGPDDRRRPLAADLDGLRAVAGSTRARDPLGRLLPGVAMSIGVVELTTPDLPSALLVADRGMYAAKRSGGDRVTGPEPVE
ncbi:GGDEF domain-containing protein [Arsenicicoccus dermatophilus]|uniref:GGDEF domain-containing protein n=1 Tax=Arsenicicoccus dermatophilus TaxID=1076331 RepID=UPI0039170AA8